MAQNEQEVAKYEQELADYLLERIKPGLNSGAIPLLARSIAKEIAHREHPNGGGDSAESEEAPDVEDSAESEEAPDVEESAESEEAPDVEDSAESEEAPDFEADMRELQADLGKDWILRFSVHGDDAWLTAEKDDGSQRVDAATASELLEEVDRL